MKVYLESSITHYLEKVEDVLLKQEVNNNLMLGLLERGRHNLGIYSDGIRLGVVEEEGEVIYAFMQTPPNNWILANVEGIDKDVIQAVAYFLDQNKYPVPGVLGPTEQVEEFVGLWKELTGKQVNLTMKQLIYQLDKVMVTPNPNGKLLLAQEEQLGLVREWLSEFAKQAGMSLTKPQADSMARSYIQNQSLYLWQVDDEFVSMTNNSRRTQNGATINAVFTPDEQKRKGHATSLVAAVSQKLLEDGFAFCSLYTDLANPTSNSIYKKIGYYVVGDSVQYQFG